MTSIDTMPDAHDDEESVSDSDVWRLQADDIPSGWRFRVSRGRWRLSFRELFRLLESDDIFADWYTETLADCAFPAYYWEHPPLTADRFDEEAEFVLIDAPLLARLRAEPSPFAAQFARQPDEDVITFPNLGGDALLIVPRPVGPLEAYPHLAAFVRHAPADQVRHLWQQTGKALRAVLGPEPRWLSTAGLGVSWLHVRLDTRPKYYQHAAYIPAR